MISSMIKYMFVLLVGSVHAIPANKELALIDKIIKHNNTLAISCELGIDCNKNDEISNIVKALNEKMCLQEAEKWGHKFSNLSTKIVSQLAYITGYDTVIEEIKDAQARLLCAIIRDNTGNEWLDKAFESMVSLFLLCISLSKDIDMSNDLIILYFSMLFTHNADIAVTLAISSASVRPYNIQSFRKIFFKEFIKYKQTTCKKTILEIIVLLIYIESVLGNDDNYPTNQEKGVEIIHMLSSCETSWICDLEVPDIGKHYDLKINDDRTGVGIYAYTDSCDIFGKENSAIYPMKSLSDGKYVSEADLRKLFNICRGFTGPIDRESDESSRCYVYMDNNTNVVLCDIIFDAFGHIAIAYDLNKNISDGLDTIQYLFRSLSSSTDIAIRVVSKSIFTNDNSTRDKMTSLVEILGIYSIFVEIKNAYWNILKYKLLAKEALDNINTSQDKKRVYDVIFSFCDSLEIRIRESIYKPDSAMLFNYGKQLSIMYNVIENTKSYFVPAAEMLRFISKIGIFDPYQIMPNIIIEINNIADCWSIAYPYLESIHDENTIYLCKIVASMINLVHCETKKIQKTVVIDFMKSCCSVIAILSSNINPSGIENLEIPQYINLRDIFLNIIDNLDGLDGVEKWKTLYFIIHHRHLHLSLSDKHVRYPYSIALLRLVVNAFVNPDLRITEWREFMSDSSHSILKKLMFQIEIKLKDYKHEDDRIFNDICSLLEQNNKLLEINGYRKVTKFTVGKKCNRCRNKIGMNSVTSLNCTCKSPYPIHFHCLIKYDIFWLVKRGGDTFAPVCSRCKK